MVYKLLGHIPSAQNANTSGLTIQEQQPPASIVYETDDENEARAIVNAGGFIRSSDDQWVVVVGMAEPSTIADNTIEERPGSSVVHWERLGADEVPERPVPQNSTAEIDSSGRIRTDPHKRPVTAEDVIERVDKGIDFNAPRRKIIP